MAKAVIYEQAASSGDVDAFLLAPVPSTYIDWDKFTVTDGCPFSLVYWQNNNSLFDTIYDGSGTGVSFTKSVTNRTMTLSVHTTNALNSEYLIYIVGGASKAFTVSVSGTTEGTSPSVGVSVEQRYMLYDGTAKPIYRQTGKTYSASTFSDSFDVPMIFGCEGLIFRLSHPEKTDMTITVQI